MVTRRDASHCSSSSSPCMNQWSEEENKLFENALAEFDDEGEADRWEKVAARVPGKTVEEVLKQYEKLVEDVELIESGRAPLPHYADDDSVGREEGNEKEKVKRREVGNRKREIERRKGVPWNEEEHRLFLIGLSKYGKGDWRSISRNCVVTRTPTQVASHAQKYFNRLNTPATKERRRHSIHDIRTVVDNPTPPATWIQPSDPTPPTTWIPTLDIPSMGGGVDALFFPSASHSSYGVQESYMSSNVVMDESGQSVSPGSSLEGSGFGELRMGNLRVGGFGNFTCVNLKDSPAYSVYDLPALQRR